MNTPSLSDFVARNAMMMNKRTSKKKREKKK
jgi:hypothetical protein